MSIKVLDNVSFNKMLHGIVTVATAVAHLNHATTSDSISSFRSRTRRQKGYHYCNQRIPHFSPHDFGITILTDNKELPFFLAQTFKLSAFLFINSRKCFPRQAFFVSHAARKFTRCLLTVLGTNVLLERKNKQMSVQKYQKQDDIC